MKIIDEHAEQRAGRVRRLDRDRRRVVGGVGLDDRELGRRGPTASRCSGRSVATTSADVNGVPSLNVTSSRSVNTSVVSSIHSQELAPAAAAAPWSRGRATTRPCMTLLSPACCSWSKFAVTSSDRAAPVEDVRQVLLVIGESAVAPGRRRPVPFRRRHSRPGRQGGRRRHRDACHQASAQRCHYHLL